MRFLILLVFLIPNIALSNKFTENYVPLFQVQLLPEALKKVSLLKKPSVIVAYLASVDQYVTNHYDVKLIDEKTLSIGFGKLKFNRYENNKYFYDLDIKNLGITEVAISIDDELFLANFLFDKNFINKLPEQLVMRVKRKLGQLFSFSKQINTFNIMDSDLKEFDSLEAAIVIKEFNKKDESTGFSYANNFSSTHKYQLITIFLIIFILMLFRDRIKREF